MREKLPLELEEGRILEGHYGSPWGSHFGAFEIEAVGGSLRIIFSGASHRLSEGWEHVSVSRADRCPNWDEMCYVKRMFWDDEECVIQYYPPRSEYVNHHPYCLHMWKPPFEVPCPPSILVGPK